MQKQLFAFTLAVLSSLIYTQSTTTPAIPSWAPVPPSALGPEIPTNDGFRVEAFGNGAFMITDGVYQAEFFVANESVILVDAPPTTGHNILKGIRRVTDLPVSHIVYSHAHADHIGAAYLLMNQSTQVIAHEETMRNLIAAALDHTRPIPNITFTEDYELNVGNQTLMLSYKGPNHQPGNIFIYAPIQKILMLVDVIYPGWAPFAHLGESSNIPNWIKAHDQVLEYDFDVLVTGHVNRAGTREDVLIQKEYVTDLYNNCAEAILLSTEPPNATNPLSNGALLSEVVAANPNNSWAFVEFGDSQRVDWCVNKTNEKWLQRLAGADVYGPSNAETMSESLKIDFGMLGQAGVQNP